MTLRLAMGLTFPLALTLALPAQAETGQQQYTIAAGPLNTVLTRFATASGTLIAGDMQLAAGKQSQGLQGSYTPAQGLSQILAGTGLVAKAQPDGSFSLAKANTSVSTLEPVKVSTTSSDK